jgi:hypothetical protein
MAAGWSSGLRSRLLNPGSNPDSEKGFGDEQLHLLTSHGVYYYHDLYMYDVCMFIRYLVSITQVHKDT